jgi:hypothetical protein
MLVRFAERAAFGLLIFVNFAHCFCVSLNTFYLQIFHVPFYVLGIQHLIGKHEPEDDLANRYSLRRIHNPSMINARCMQAQKIVILREITRPSLRAKARCSWSEAASIPASMTVRTSTPRWRRPFTTAFATCSSV